MKRILIATDGSETARTAIDAGLGSYPQVSTYHEATHLLQVPFAEEAAAVLDQIVGVFSCC